jgi:hypothetical protein
MIQLSSQNINDSLHSLSHLRPMLCELLSPLGVVFCVAFGWKIVISFGKAVYLGIWGMWTFATCSTLSSTLLSHHSRACWKGRERNCENSNYPASAIFPRTRNDVPFHHDRQRQNFWNSKFTRSSAWGKSFEELAQMNAKWRTASERGIISAGKMRLRNYELHIFNSIMPLFISSGF